ncbi:MAG: nuclear transport factor 2 family protein [Pseudohongiellaceae bacterium]
MENKSAPANCSSAEALVKNFMDFYAHLSLERLSGLEEIYTQDIEFVDPIHGISGLLALKNYMKTLIRNMQHYRICYQDHLVGENSACVAWEMDYAHKSVKGGQIITLRGITRLKFTTRVYFHEDCYDLGALLYDHLPVLGSVTGLLKRRLAARD